MYRYVQGIQVRAATLEYIVVAIQSRNQSVDSHLRHPCNHTMLMTEEMREGRVCHKREKTTENDHLAVPQMHYKHYGWMCVSCESALEYEYTLPEKKNYGTGSTEYKSCITMYWKTIWYKNSIKPYST